MTSSLAPKPFSRAQDGCAQDECAQHGGPGDEPMFDLIELLFFAYRDFVGDADRVLASYDFGRAHHRILHFVNRQPGLTITELLDILAITKQSLNRVLKELVEQDFVASLPGESDRRQRHLFPTAKGAHLARELARLQSARFARALAELPEGGRETAITFLFGMIERDERARVAALIRGGRTATASRASIARP